MADFATNTAASRWHILMARREEFVHKLAAAPADRDTLEEQLAAVEEVLLNEPAPDAGASLFKLELLWNGQLDGENEDAKRKRMILAELGNAFA